MAQGTGHRAQGTITGTVTTSEGEAIHNANVFIHGIMIGDATDQDGRYTIVNSPAGSHTLIVAVLDFRMPGRNSLDGLRDINTSNPANKVVTLTNYPYPHYRNRCVEEGADFFFDKSSEFEKVIAVLEQLVIGGQL